MSISVTKIIKDGKLVEKEVEEQVLKDIQQLLQNEGFTAEARSFGRSPNKGKYVRGKASWKLGMKE